MKKYLALIAISALFLSSCGKKATNTEVSPSPTPRLVELELSQRPEISLTPRADGHELTLKFTSISSEIKKIEYELTYLAVDGELEIEKGVSGTIDQDDFVSASANRKLLLGTESCTNGCKYKYDSGVSGGNLIVTFTTNSNQIASFETPFALKTTADIKKDGKLSLQDEFSLTPKAKLTGSDYFIVLKSYQGGYSVFSNTNSALNGQYPSSQ